MAESSKASQFETDELTRTIDEYRVKLDEIVRKERERVGKLVGDETKNIVDGAWQKAEEIINQSQREAQRVREEIEEQARQEASRIVYDAKYNAKQIMGEAEEKAKKEAKSRTKSEVEKMLSRAKEEADNIIARSREAAKTESSEIIDKAKQEAERFVSEDVEKCRTEAQRQSTQLITEAREKAERLIDDVIDGSMEIHKRIVEIMQKTETIIDRFKSELQTELDESSKAISATREELRHLMIENQKSDENVAVVHLDEELYDSAILSVQLKGEKLGGGNGGKPLFKGQMELKTISPYEYVQIKKLKNSLAKVPNIKYAGEVTSEEETKILFEVEEPLPLLEILNNVPSVEEVVEQEDSVRLILQN